MAKRRIINRSSKQFFKNESNDSISSKFLDPDTSIKSEEQTYWWKNLDENMSSPHSLIHNSRNETPQQLNLNSELESNHNTSQWWKHLEFPNSRSNTSRRLRPNLSAAINKANVLETSTSESEKEFSLRKRKVPLIIANRKSDSKTFLDVLNDTEVAIPIKCQLKQTQYSNLHDNSDRKILEISKDHTNAISAADRTNTNEIEEHKIISDHKSFITKDASSTSNVRKLLIPQVVNAEKWEKARAEVDKIISHERAVMEKAAEKIKSTLKAITVKLFGATRKQPMKKNISPKVDKAYLVNGKLRKLPRSKRWVTNHFYKFLWKRMKPKYKLLTRMRSEKFVIALCERVSIIERCKKYKNYKLELEALIKEMARLNIINTRNDFHHFCHEFLPSEVRMKVIPMILPGNIQNIPFDIEKLHTPILEET